MIDLIKIYFLELTKTQTHRYTHISKQDAKVQTNRKS